MSIIEEIPFWKYKIDVAMKLREAMLINGMLYNSESWHGVTSKHMKRLEAVDEALLRNILKAHSKTPLEFLYLETGSLQLRWIVAQRRIVFMQQIMRRHDNDLLKKVFLAQKQNPTQGDFVKIVESDLTDLGVTFEQVTSSNTSKVKCKDCRF